MAPPQELRQPPNIYLEPVRKDAREQWLRCSAQKGCNEEGCEEGLYEEGGSQENGWQTGWSKENPLKRNAEALNMPIKYWFADNKPRYCKPDASRERIGASEALHHVLQTKHPTLVKEIESRMVERLDSDMAHYVYVRTAAGLHGWDFSSVTGITFQERPETKYHWGRNPLPTDVQRQIAHLVDADDPPGN